MLECTAEDSKERGQHYVDHTESLEEIPSNVVLVQTVKFYNSLLEKLKKLDPTKLRTPLKK